MPAQSSRENDVHTSPDDNAFTDDERHARWEEQERAASSAVRDIADVAAVEIITTTAVHLMSAAAVKVGLADDPESQTDLDEARKLINALAGLITAAAPEVSDMHARSPTRSARDPARSGPARSPDPAPARTRPVAMAERRRDAAQRARCSLTDSESTRVATASSAAHRRASRASTASSSC
jgi:hypothetical protein